MQITLTVEDGGVFPLEVSAELTLEDLKALLEIETGMAPQEMLLVHNMAPMLVEQKTLGDYDVRNDDIIMISRVNPGDVNISNPTPLSQPPVTMATPQQLPAPSGGLPFVDWGSIPVPGGSTPQQPISGGQSTGTLPPIDWGSIQVPGASGNTAPQQPPRPDPNDPETVRQHFLSNPYELSVLRARNPHLAEALLDEDPQRFRDALEEQMRSVREMERDRIRMINADPLDPEYQTRIAQSIQQRNIQDNMEAALEYMPESFSRVVMLYLPIKVNGVTVKALVDSGARSTIMSERCAERCNIMRLVDRRFAGVAFGVGRQKIIGKVHLGQLQIGNDFLTSSFQVLQDQAEDMLLGLDMLRRHQCCIDLKKNVLRIGTTGSEAAFLTEADLKEKEEMEKQQAQRSMEDEDAEMAAAIEKSENDFHGPGTSSGIQSGPTGAGPSSSAPPSQTLPQQQSRSPFPESSISRITSAGFSREEAIAELQKSGGNADLALTSLFAKSIKF